MTAVRTTGIICLALSLAGLIGCSACPHGCDKVAAERTPLAGGRYGKSEADARTRAFANTAQTEIIVESDRQEAHYSGVGGIHFEYWTIHYRNASSQCYSLNTIHATAFTVSGDPMYCGAAPGKVYQTLHISSDDVVP